MNDLELNETELFVYRSSPVFWLNTADELKDSCDILVNDNSIVGYSEPLNGNKEVLKAGVSKSFFLLAGFAIENLIKGTLIYNKPELINQGKLVKSLKTHNLMKLIEGIPEIVLSTAEKELVASLSSAIPYWGRYPSPLIASELEIEEYLTPTKIILFNSIYAKFHKNLCKMLENGWDPKLPNGAFVIGGFKHYRLK